MSSTATQDELPLLELYILLLLFRAPADSRLVLCGMAELGFAATATGVDAALDTMGAAGLVRASEAGAGFREITWEGEAHLRAAMAIVRRIRDAILAQGAREPETAAAQGGPVSGARGAPGGVLRDEPVGEPLDLGEGRRVGVVIE